MNLLTTLFGGALLIVVLYFVLGALRWPNYWRAVVSGGALLLAYLVIAARNWPGLDAVAMHVAVFIATAVILSLLNVRRAEPSKKLHWAPKVIIGFFLLLFAIDGVFIYVASHGLPEFMAKRFLPEADKGGAHTAFPGVMPHGEDAAKGISAHLKQQATLSRLGWQIEIEGLERIVLNQATEIKVRAQDRAGMPLTDAQVSLALYRPAQREPHAVVSLGPGASGVYRGMLRMAEAGDWLVVIRITQGQDVLELQQPITR
ncbi:MAG: FixH family protein [Bradyrhizobium sp.]|nr:FixH family protein [Bradyrhizobium sp.]